MMRSLVIAAVMATGLWQAGQGASIKFKAWLGQALLERAWVKTSEAEQPVSPWPGAVSHPVARLSMPELKIDRLVLDGAEDPVLAWGPGMEVGPFGHHMIAAHRDTHFRFLEQVELDDVLLLERPDRSIQRWRVVDRAIVDAREIAIDMSVSQELLTLVTCYPFNAASSGGPLRFIVSLVPDVEDATT